MRDRADARGQRYRAMSPRHHAPSMSFSGPDAVPVPPSASRIVDRERTTSPVDRHAPPVHTPRSTKQVDSTPAVTDGRRPPSSRASRSAHRRRASRSLDAVLGEPALRAAGRGHRAGSKHLVAGLGAASSASSRGTVPERRRAPAKDHAATSPTRRDADRDLEPGSFAPCYERDAPSSGSCARTPTSDSSAVCLWSARSRDHRARMQPARRTLRSDLDALPAARQRLGAGRSRDGPHHRPDPGDAVRRRGRGATADHRRSALASPRTWRRIEAVHAGIDRAPRDPPPTTSTAWRRSRDGYARSSPRARQRQTFRTSRAGRTAMRRLA